MSRELPASYGVKVVRTVHNDICSNCCGFVIFAPANRFLFKTCMIKIKEVGKSDRNDALIDKLTLVWEDSVRSTHIFLSEDAIAEIKEFFPGALREIAHLTVAVNGLKEPVGFMGVRVGQ